VGKKKVRATGNTATRTYMDKKVFFSQAGLLTCGSSSDCTFPFKNLNSGFFAVVVPAYSAGPTLRIYTVFPFHHRGFPGHLADM